MSEAANAQEARTDFLTAILRRRGERVAQQRATIDIAALRDAANAKRANKEERRLSRALRQPGTNIIAEFKRASPSKGAIHLDADPAAIAASYKQGGACGISVLTEEDYFRGSLDDLIHVRAAIDLPILRKDFIIDDLQIHEAADAGADAVLLIVRALTNEELIRFRRLAEDELKLDALVEVHTADEMRRAIDCGATLIGVNNRDLDTFHVTLDTSERLAALAPPDATLVTESGLRDRADIERLKACGYHGFLIGETLMRGGDPAALLAQLIGTVGDTA